MPKIPSYRKRLGSSQAIVTLTDSPTGNRRDYWLGEHGTPSSRELYFRLIAEWEANVSAEEAKRPREESPPSNHAPVLCERCGGERIVINVMIVEKVPARPPGRSDPAILTRMGAA